MTGAIVDAVASERPGERLLIADPFAGGGVIALAALLRGHRVYAQDVNPWAAQSLTTMLALPPPDELAASSDRLHAAVEPLLRQAYDTTFDDGSAAQIAHTLRVATGACPGCGRTLRLFPSATVSQIRRVDCGGEEGYLACPAGHLNVGSTVKRSSCGTCRRYIHPRAQYTSGRTARCHDCRWTGKLAELAGPHGFDWEVVLVERTSHNRREIARPTTAEVRWAADRSWHPKRVLPEIDPGVETSALLRHGMRRWHDLYPARQRVVLETLLDHCATAAVSEAAQRALTAAVVGSAEMAGHASRWDARYLKAYEAVSNHRFSFTTLAVEPNVWGASSSGRGTVDRRLGHAAKAAVWLEERVGRPLVIEGPVPATQRRTPLCRMSDARIAAGGSQRMVLPEGALDAVVTDPPYHDDVQYGELSDLFRAWAGAPTGALAGDAVVSRNGTGNRTADYQEMLTDIFTEIGRALRAEGHLVLSYANRQPSAWVALFNALHRAGFQVVGFTVVHSENETDHSKAGRRACTMDVLIDAVPAGATRLRRYRPRALPQSDEAAFCGIVGTYALRVGRLKPGWEEGFVSALKSTPFLAASTSVS